MTKCSAGLARSDAEAMPIASSRRSDTASVVENESDV
jgi:hypothetical protein